MVDGARCFEIVVKRVSVRLVQEGRKFWSQLIALERLSEDMLMGGIDDSVGFERWDWKRLAVGKGKRRKGHGNFIR